MCMILLRHRRKDRYFDLCKTEIIHEVNFVLLGKAKINKPGFMQARSISYLLWSFVVFCPLVKLRTSVLGTVTSPERHGVSNQQRKREILTFLALCVDNTGQCSCWWSLAGRLNIKTPSYQNSIKDETFSRPSYHYNVNTIPGKTDFTLKRALVSVEHCGDSFNITIINKCHESLINKHCIVAVSAVTAFFAYFPYTT